MYTYSYLRSRDIDYLKNVLDIESKGLEKNKQEGLWWRIERSNKMIAKIEKVIKEKEMNK